MTKDDMAALRDNLAAQVSAQTTPVKAIIVLIAPVAGSEMTWRGVNIGAGEMLDRIEDMRRGIIENLKTEKRP